MKKRARSHGHTICVSRKPCDGCQHRIHGTRQVQGFTEKSPVRTYSGRGFFHGIIMICKEYSLSEDHALQCIVSFDAAAKLHLKIHLNTGTEKNPALFLSIRNPHKHLLAGGVEIILKKLGEQCDVLHVHPHKFRNPNLNKIQTFCQHSTPYKYSASRKF